MCITTISQKYRTQKCDQNTNVTTVGNLTFVLNITFSSYFCSDDDETFPWYIPEWDIYNQHHMSFYNSNDANQEIDVSTQDFPNVMWIVAPSNEIIIKTAVFVPLVLWGIFANISLLYIILKFRHLRTATNMIIANMAMADLTSLLIYPWMFLITDFFQNYQFGEFGCKVDGWWEFSLLLINVMNLSTITYDRLTAIVLPNETRLTRRGAKIVIIFSWIFGFLLACPLIIFRKYTERQWKNFLEIYCTEDTAIVAIYWHVLLVMAVWLPLAIMLICYCAIFIKLDRYEQKVLKRENPIIVCYKTKVAKVVFLVVITFIVCRLPFTALIFRRTQWLKMNKKDQVLGASQILWFIARYLIYANAALDPLLYGLTNENFRRALRATPITKFFFPIKKKQKIIKKMCVNVIQPHKSDKSLILKNNSVEDKVDSSQKTDKMIYY